MLDQEFCVSSIHVWLSPKRVALKGLIPITAKFLLSSASLRSG